MGKKERKPIRTKEQKRGKKNLNSNCQEKSFRTTMTKGERREGTPKKRDIRKKKKKEEKTTPTHDSPMD